MPSNDAIEFEVHVRPRASISALAGLHDGVLAVRVCAPPADDQANHAVIKLLATSFGVRASAVEIIRGASARRKVVRIHGDVDRLTSVLHETGASRT